MIDKADKRRAARILDSLGVKTGLVRLGNVIVVENINNSKTSMSVGWNGSVIGGDRTPDVADLLKDRTRREFVIVD